MSLKSIFNELKLDFSNLIVSPDGGGGENYSFFEVNPREFLKYAKEDYHSNSKRGLINSITNAKRAIDCEVDTALKIYGIDCFDLPKALEPFMKLQPSNNLPYKLQIIQALNLAPGLILSKVRTLRHKLEHYYVNPSKEDVQEAIDIADLFIRSIDGKTRILDSEFQISDGKLNSSRADRAPNPTVSLRVNFNDGVFSLYPSKKEKSLETFCLEASQSEYYPLLRVMNSQDDDHELVNSFRMLAQLCEMKIPLEHISAQMEY
jgi:hypothetical protein